MEAGQRILRRHIKGVDAYFRMFFAEGHGAAQGSVPAAKAERRAARPARAAPGKPKVKAATKAVAQR